MLNGRMQILVAAVIVAACMGTTLVAASSENDPSASLSFTVAPGDELRSTMRFVVPDPASTDVAVLLDSTGSESRDLSAIGAALVGALDKADNNATMKVAVALAGDVPTFPFGTSTDRPYRLLQQSTGSRAAWTAALSSLEAIEGGGDDKEGQLPAIVELLTSTSSNPDAQAVAVTPRRAPRARGHDRRASSRRHR